MSPALQSQLTATLDSLDSAFLEPNPSNFKTLTHVIAVLARGAGARDTTSFSEEALNDNPHFVSLLSSYAAVQDCITAITTSQYSSLNSSVVTVGNLGRSLNLSLTQVRQMRAAIAATKTTLQVSTEQEDGDAEAAVIDSHRLSDLYQTKQQCEAVLQLLDQITFLTSFTTTFPKMCTLTSPNDYLNLCTYFTEVQTSLWSEEMMNMGCLKDVMEDVVVGKEKAIAKGAAAIVDAILNIQLPSQPSKPQGKHKKKKNHSSYNSDSDSDSSSSYSSSQSSNSSSHGHHHFTPPLAPPTAATMERKNMNLTSPEFIHQIPVYCQALSLLSAQSHITPSFMSSLHRFSQTLTTSFHAGLDTDIDGLHTLFEGIVSRYKKLVDRVRYTADCVALSAGMEKQGMYKSLTGPIADKLVKEVVGKITEMVLETSTEDEGRASFRASERVMGSPSPAKPERGGSETARGTVKLFDLQISTTTEKRTARSARRKSSVLGLGSATVYSYLTRHMNKHPTCFFRRVCELRSMILSVKEYDEQMHEAYRWQRISSATGLLDKVDKCIANVIIPTLQDQSISSVADTLDADSAFSDGSAFSVLLSATAEAFECATWIDGSGREDVVGVCEAAIALVMGRARQTLSSFGSDTASDKGSAYKDFVASYEDLDSSSAHDMPPPPGKISRQVTSATETDYDSFADELTSLNAAMSVGGVHSPCSKLSDLRLAVALCDSLLTTALLLDARVRAVESVAGMSKARSLRQAVKNMTSVGKEFARVIRRAVQLQIVSLMSELNVEGIVSGTKIAAIESVKDWVGAASEIVTGVNSLLGRYMWFGVDYVVEKLVYRRFMDMEAGAGDRTMAAGLAAALEDLRESLDLETDGLCDTVAFLGFIGKETKEDARKCVQKDKGKGLNVGEREVSLMYKVFGL